MAFWPQAPLWCIYKNIKKIGEQLTVEKKRKEKLTMTQQIFSSVVQNEPQLTVRLPKLECSECSLVWVISHWLKSIMCKPDRTWGYSASCCLNQMPRCLAQGELQKVYFIFIFFLLPGVARGGVGKLLQCYSVLGFPLATAKNKRPHTQMPLRSFAK